MVIRSLKQVKKLAIAAVGFAVLAAGIAMIVLPGPAIVVIPIGLGILATEFVWAKTMLHQVKERIIRMRAQLGSRPS